VKHFTEGQFLKKTFADCAEAFNCFKNLGKKLIRIKDMSLLSETVQECVEDVSNDIEISENLMSSNSS
jgi:hypothetical protein